MLRTVIGDLRSHIDETVMIKGWLHVLRDQKKIQFLVLRDRTGMVQITHWKPNDEALAALVSTLTTESALTITGKVADNPSVKLGGLEIQLESLQVDNLAENPLPFEPFGDKDNLPALDYRLDWRSIDLRRTENLLLFRVQTTMEMALREFWIQNGFMEIHSPKLMGSPSESGAELFELAYFETKAYLAQSPQFYKQMAMAGGFENVFEIGPVFRADPSFTSRHMTEFTSIDMEMSWVDSEEDVMSNQERMLQYAYQRVKDVHGSEIEAVFGFTLAVPAVPFPRLTMVQSHEILNQVGYQLSPEKKNDLDPGAERAVGEYIKQTTGSDFVYITEWPFAIRPFYHMKKGENLTRSFDLIAGGLEITTGAQREHRYDVLVAQAKEKGLSPDLIQYYLDFFRYGCPPHGGYGMGLSRLLMVMLKQPNIRETVYLFRGPNRLQP